ncbi:MAG: 2,3-bisphosphoglycerate-independent phosphoglycerate mutase [Gammaproteobacteria bacterium]
MPQRAPTALIILDGWGHRPETEHNAIAQANLPHWHHLLKTCPNTLVSGSGEDVGLPASQMGNSEVGHMNIGAGRVVYQDLTRINHAIRTGLFRDNPTLKTAIETCRDTGTALHIMGLLSPGGVHSQEEHIAALCEWAKDEGLPRLYIHAFLDGRDTPPKSAANTLERFEALLAGNPEHRIASLIGRFYAMDRDKRWDRVQTAYELITHGICTRHVTCAQDGLEAAYAADETDEFVSPTVIGQPARVADGDTVVFMNFRSDRARELTQAFTESQFDGFARSAPAKLKAFITLTEYEADTKARVAFSPESLHDTLGEVLSRHDIKQLRIAETEKYAHVTFFLNGGVETVFPNEERILIPSPTDVRTYYEKPEMSAEAVTDQLVEAIRNQTYGGIICNFANSDMVGHTGNFEAAVKAVETIDRCLKRITDALSEVGGQCLITADHGNVEMMVDPETGQPHTAHTCDPVPLVYVGPQDLLLSPGGVLADIAPTLLSLMELPQPEAMTGRVLSTPTTH